MSGRGWQEEGGRREEGGGGGRKEGEGKEEEKGHLLSDVTEASARDPIETALH